MEDFQIVAEHQLPTSRYWKLMISEAKSGSAVGTIYIPKEEPCPKKIIVTVTGG